MSTIKVCYLSKWMDEVHKYRTGGDFEFLILFNNPNFKLFMRGEYKNKLNQKTNDSISF